MRHALTRLELNGFKSFANKTVLDFPAGITAIVGPNGSGKSNIIDAIRWLLGEREAKNLRGGKSEDLIFAGSEKRPRMSLAQASLFFDASELKELKNKEISNRLISSDVSEIAVMREVHRDGANQYFLNKSEVRLKDLVDFFAQARLGTKGLTVITQGNSDLFIRVTPAERRAMIEEILGLREFQMKKTDAERRLRNAQINLDKAKALAEEILPHLRSLRRQTSRWEKRGELEKELLELENQFFGSKLKELNASIQKIEAEVKEYEAEFSKLDGERMVAEKNIKDLEQSHPSERKELERIRVEIQKLREWQAEYQKAIGKLQGQMEFLEKRGETKVTLPADTLFSLLKKVKEELESNLNKSLEELKAAVQGVLRDVGAIFSKAGKEENNEHGDISQKLAELQSQNKELENQISELRTRESSLEKNQEQFYAEFKKAVDNSQEIKTHLDKWQSHNRERILEKERLHMRREELENQINQAGRNPKDFLNIRLNILEDAANLEKRIFRLRGDLASMGEADEVVMKEARETEERYNFLTKEVEDLESAQADLKKLIMELNDKIRHDFDGAFQSINEEFQKFFELMFGGGKARLRLEKPEKRIFKSEIEETEAASAQSSGEPMEEEEKEEGVEISLSLPKKRINSLDMLSGGERSLVGIAAIFAMVSVSPPPFLVLDEIDAPLDEKNARRFGEMLQEFAKKTQFIVVTHNRATMEAADVLYGVTLNEDGTSKILSMKFESK